MGQHRVGRLGACAAVATLHVGSHVCSHVDGDRHVDGKAAAAAVAAAAVAAAAVAAAAASPLGAGGGGGGGAAAVAAALLGKARSAALGRKPAI